MLFSLKANHNEVLRSVQPDSPYKGGMFSFKLTLPEDFPFKAPTVWRIVAQHGDLY